MFTRYNEHIWGQTYWLVCKVSEILDVIDFKFGSEQISSSLYFSLVVQFYQMYPRLNNKL